MSARKNAEKNNGNKSEGKKFVIRTNANKIIFETDSMENARLILRACKDCDIQYSKAYINLINEQIDFVNKQNIND